MIYFDTSYMLKCYLPEHGHIEVNELWRQSDDVVCCELGKAEFAAALHRHLREGRITSDGLREVLATWRDDQAAGWRRSPTVLLTATPVGRAFRVGRIPTRRSNRYRPSDNRRFEAERSSPSENPTGR